MKDPAEIRLMRITVEALKRAKLPFSKDEKWCKRTERFTSHRVRGVWVLCVGNGTVSVQSEMNKPNNSKIEETFKNAGLNFSKNDENWMYHQWTVSVGE